MKLKSALASLMILATVVSMGCKSDGGRYAESKKTWRHPGTIQQQRIRATVHDPYPDQDAGPDVVGGRPRDYQQPLAEPVRNRMFMDSR